jgi:type II secretory pathway pseudopilin PulG
MMRRRKGFTLVELLVAMALIIFIMYILAEAFSAATAAFRSLKAVGDMNEKLRTTSTILRRYLSADHFEGRKRLSDANFWKDGPPREGFLRIWQGTDSVDEGTDLDGNHSFAGYGADNALHFTVKLRGNSRDDFFRATVPPNSPLLLLPNGDTRFQEAGTGTFCSSWAEVAVFTRPSGETTEDPNNPLTLYTLYMRQRLAIQDNSLVSPTIPSGQYTANGNYVEMSCYRDLKTPNILYFNSPADLTMPARRLGKKPGPNTFARPPAFTADWANSNPISSYPTLAEEAPRTGGKLAGDDVLLTNVLSFEVRVLLPRKFYAPPYVPQAVPYDFLSLASPVVQQFNSFNNPKFYNPVNNPKGPYVFDTWTSTSDDVCDYSGWNTATTAQSIPLYVQQRPPPFPQDKIRILAIQITVRIWDLNTKQSRQTSIVVDM